MPYIDLADHRVPKEWRTSAHILQLMTEGCRLHIDDHDGHLALCSQKVERLAVPAIRGLVRLDDCERLSTPAIATDYPTLADKWNEEDAVLSTPSADVLRNSLLSRFRTRSDGWNYCGPLNRWNPPGKPFLCGYAATWDTPTTEKKGGYHLIMRRGCFGEALATGSPTAAWIEHQPDMLVATTTRKKLAVLEDDNGLAVFCDPSDWKYGVAIASLVRDGKFSQMSFQHDPDREQLDTFAIRGRAYRETLAVKTLPEVSFVEAAANPSTIALAVGSRYDNTAGHYWDRAFILNQASRSKM